VTSRRGRLIGLVVLLLLLLGAAVVLWPKPAPSPQATRTKAPAQPPARDFVSVSGDTCCERVPDPSVNDQGRIVVTFPASVNASGTMSYAFRPGEPKPVWIQVGGGSTTIAPGAYDIEVRKVRFTNVSVQPGQGTRVRAGALRVTAGQSTTYEIWDAGETRRIADGYGRTEFGLAAGSYVLKMNGQSRPVTVVDGKVTDL
jgi:hypothetical protein